MEGKRNTGIPRSFIERDKDPENNPIIQPSQVPPEEKQVIPEDLICSICKDLFTDAVMIPCCGSSFCDECVRTALLESEDNECPDCKEKGSSPGSLIPNRFLRNSVNAFRNETGYTKTVVQKGMYQKCGNVGFVLMIFLLQLHQTSKQNRPKILPMLRLNQ